MGALLVGHVRTGGLGLVVVTLLIHLFKRGDGRQHEPGTEPACEKSPRTSPPRSVPGTWIDSDRSESVFPEEKVAFLNLS